MLPRRDLEGQFGPSKKYIFVVGQKPVLKSRNSRPRVAERRPANKGLQLTLSRGGAPAT